MLQNMELSIKDLEKQRCDEYNLLVGNMKYFDCEKCLNKGYIAKLSDDDVMVLVECECSTKRGVYRKIKESGLGVALYENTFKSFEAETEWQKGTKSQALDFVENHGDNWFFIGGQVGSGKTHICTAIVGQLIKRGMSCRYMMWRDEVISIKANVNDDVAYSKFINPLKTAQVLYIDDFLKIPKEAKSPTQGDLNVAFELINYRYAANLTTIISSEHISDRIIDFEESVGSRIYEKSKKYSVLITQGKDKNYRLRGATL